MIKAVLFDIDGVLIDSHEANVVFFQNLLVKAGYKKPAKETVWPLFPLTMKDVIKVLLPKAVNEEIERVWQMGVDSEVGFPYHMVTVPDGEREIIKKLSGKYLLGIVTSRVIEGVYSIPIFSELKEYFKAIAAYGDTENHKPSPDPVLFACKKLGVKPWEAVYIGDAEADLLAGKAAGAKVIIYGGYENKDADTFTSSFSALPQIIKSLF